MKAREREERICQNESFLVEKKKKDASKFNINDYVISHKNKVSENISLVWCEDVTT